MSKNYQDELIDNISKEQIEKLILPEDRNRIAVYGRCAGKKWMENFMHKNETQILHVDPGFFPEPKKEEKKGRFVTLRKVLLEETLCKSSSKH